MHRERRLRVQTAMKSNQKTIVMGMFDRESRQVRAKVVPNVKRETLQSEILSHIERGSTVYTDGYPAYNRLAAQDYIHATVNHIEEYVRGNVHTQAIDFFGRLLKRFLNGTYVAVEPFHLDRYVTEQVFRYNNRATKDNPLLILIALLPFSRKSLASVLLMLWLLARWEKRHTNLWRKASY